MTSVDLSKILPAQVVNNKGVKLDVSSITKGVVGLYFSAHWCPPCRMFTPQLAKLYNDLKADATKPFELIFVSSDRDQKSFDEYMHDMPWHAVPFSDRSTKNALSELFQVEGIPTLVLIDAEKKTVITTEGREEVEGGVKAYPFYPARVKTLDAGSSVISNGTPALIAIIDQLDSKAVDTVVAELKSAGEDSKNGDLGLLYADSSSKMVGRFRTFFGIADQAPAIVFVSPEGKFLTPFSSLNSANPITDAIAKFRAGQVPPHRKSAARPAGDDDPEHVGMKKVVASSFQAVVLDDSKDVFLDAWAPWCGPCVAVGPHIANVAETLHELKLSNPVIAKINVDENDTDDTYLPETTIPNMKLFKKNAKKSSVKYDGKRDGASLLTWLHKECGGFDLPAALAKLTEVEKKNAGKH